MIIRDRVVTPDVTSLHNHFRGGRKCAHAIGGSLYSTEYGIANNGIANNGIAELRNKRKSHSKHFVIVYSLYNILIYIPHLVENTITIAPILGAIFK